VGSIPIHVNFDYTEASGTEPLHNFQTACMKNQTYLSLQ